MFKSFSMDLAGRTLTVEVGRVAKQANGAAFMHYGDTVVLSTATASDKPRDGIDFFPLSVEFEEKLYAVGKIPGGFTKREGKASENAVLTARVIDRPMRPLFPKDYRNDVTLDNIVMSVDPELKQNKYGKGKYLLRRAFLEDGCLPEEILWREKAAFSDAVGHSMVDYLKAYAEEKYTQEEFEKKAAEYSYARPFTKESLLYREIFESYYPGQAEMIAGFWMPNRDWRGCDVNDPSARVLSNYGASGK